MVKVSVVMPVYNTKRFLKDSIDSILNQTIKDIELICVDDGSDDGSLEILYEFAKKDDRVKVFSLDHQGAGNARNYAIQYTTGEYLYFMDSDDFLDLNAFEDFCDICESKELDFLLFKLINYDVDEDRYYENNYYNMPEISNLVKGKVFNYKDLGNLIFKVNSSTCSKFYNRNFVLETGARFREYSKFNDNQFFWDVMFSAKRIYFLDEFYYTRTRHNASLTGSGDLKHIDIIGVVNDIIDLFIKHDQLENFKKVIYNKKIAWVLLRYDQIKEEYKELFYQELKADFIKLEGTDFWDSLWASNRYVFDSVLISKNYRDFNILKEFYINIKNNNLSFEKRITEIKKWFNYLNEDYKNYFFGTVKTWLKKYYDENGLSADNRKFYEKFTNAKNFIEFNNIKVSVVMPVYNTKRFLKDSIDSILNQTIKDIELICVDDGSDDGSLEILYEFAKKDDRVKVFSLDHQGAGNARNYAIQYTTGEYLYFMDSDDFLDLNAFEDFCDICESKELDFLLFKLINYDVDEDRYYENNYYNMPEISNLVKGKVFNYKDLGNLIFKVNSSTCSKFYNRNFVLETGARFREYSKFNDNQFFWDVMFSAKRIYFLDEFYYTRTRHNASLTGSEDNYVDIITVLNDTINLFIKYNQFDKFKEILYNKKVTQPLYIYGEIDDKYKGLLYNELKKDYERFENSEIKDILWENNLFIYESILISKNHEDFKVLKRFYQYINFDNTIFDDRISLFKQWFISLDEIYKSYFFNTLKFWVERFDNGTKLCSENKEFYDFVMLSENYMIFNSLRLFKSNDRNLSKVIRNINYSSSSIIENVDGLSKLNDEFFKIAEIQNNFNQEYMNIIYEYNIISNELKKPASIIDKKDDEIFNLNSEININKSIIGEKNNEIEDINNKINDFRLNIVEKESLISDLCNELEVSKSIISEKDKLISNLKSNISKLNNEIKLNKDNIDEKDKIISKLNNEIKLNKDNIDEKDKIISDLNHKNINYSSLIRKNTIQLDKINSDILHLSKINKKLYLENLQYSRGMKNIFKLFK